EQLRQLARDGQLQPADLLWRQGMESWVPARRIKGLLAEMPEVPRRSPQVLGKRPLWVWWTGAGLLALGLLSGIALLAWRTSPDAVPRVAQNQKQAPSSPLTAPKTPARSDPLPAESREPTAPPDGAPSAGSAPPPPVRTSPDAEPADPARAPRLVLDT